MNRRNLLIAAGALALGLGWGAMQLIDPIEDRTRPLSSEGRTVFEEACARCHGPGGEGKGGSPRLRGRGLGPAYVRKMVRGGYRAMPRFPNIRGEALLNIARYVGDLK